MTEKKEYRVRSCGTLVPVTQEVYQAYYQAKRHDKTLCEKDERNGLVSYDGMDTEDILGEEMIPDRDAISVEDTVIAMYISESVFTIGNAGTLEIPAAVLREMGLHAGDPVCVAYLTHDGQQNSFREFLLSANPLDELTDEAQIRVPDHILEEANLPADADLQILCLNGYIVICQDSALTPDELAAVLEQLRTADEFTAALPDSPEQVCDQLEEFIDRFQERTYSDDAQ